MSGQVFLIADLHLSHRNMAIKRGFPSIKEHDQHIINCWNSVVDKGDTVWILGDITMEKKSSYVLLDQLKGYKNVVLGNHDRRQDVSELLKYVNSVCGMTSYKGYILTHCPIHESELSRYKGNIHGHTHEYFITKLAERVTYGDCWTDKVKDLYYINVSCEVIDYTPQLFSKIIDRIQ